MNYVWSLLGLAALTAGCSRSLAPAATTSPAAASSVALAAPAVALDTVNTPKAKQLLAQPGTLVLDVRTPAEYQAGHLPAARNLDVNADSFRQQLTQLDPQRTYVVYCHSGKRSRRAIDLMYQQGFRNLVNGGGYDSLK